MFRLIISLYQSGWLLGPGGYWVGWLCDRKPVWVRWEDDLSRKRLEGRSDVTTRQNQSRPAPRDVSDVPVVTRCIIYRLTDRLSRFVNDFANSCPTFMIIATNERGYFAAAWGLC